MPESGLVTQLHRNQPNRRPVRSSGFTPPSAPLTHAPAAAPAHGAGGLFAGQQEKIRRRHHEARFAALRSKGAHIVEAMGEPLPTGSQVLRLGMAPTLFEMVHAALPHPLQSRKNYEVLAQELTGERLAKHGASFIGAGEHVLPQLEGSNATWHYRCRVRVSLALADKPSRSTPIAAGMSHSSTANSALTYSHGLTTGATFSAGGIAGTQMGLLQPGGTGSATVGYKHETAKGFSRTLGHDRSDTFTYPEGATVIDTRARLSIRIDWDKRSRTLALWARGQNHKELTMDGLGWSSSDGTSAQLLDFAEIFSNVPVTYAVPSALSGPSVAEAGTNTRSEGEIWV
ncbi:hypothetical protein ACWD4B_03135 [Streptomyces sp. NPDC002536]